MQDGLSMARAAYSCRICRDFCIFAKRSLGIDLRLPTYCPTYDKRSRRLCDEIAPPTPRPLLRRRLECFVQVVRPSIADSARFVTTKIPKFTKTIINNLRSLRDLCG